jgi:glycosyltransferase involved in cell wall biosynthesis
MSSPEVSVVIPTYNRPDLLSRAIESVLDQTYTDFECLVVDDASPADSSSVVTGFDDDRLKYFEHETNQGASAARNTGIEQADGEYIAFLDDDDEWLPTKLEKQVGLFHDQSDDVGLIYSWMNYKKQSGELIYKYEPTHNGYIFPHVLDGQRIGSCSTLVVRTKVARQVDGFDEDLPRGNDGDFIRRVSREYKIEFVPEILVNYYVEHGSDRITSEDEQGIRNAIHGKQTKLRKFGEELNHYPKRKAMIYSNLARRYGQVGEYNNSIRYHARAVTASPNTLEVYKNIARTARDALF